MYSMEYNMYNNLTDAVIEPVLACFSVLSMCMDDSVNAFYCKKCIVQDCKFVTKALLGEGCSMLIACCALAC